MRQAHDRGVAAATTWPNFGRWVEESPQRGCAGGGARRQLLFGVAMACVGLVVTDKRVLTRGKGGFGAA
jgi:hypothetical protein